jgi:hypothetical protein
VPGGVSSGRQDDEGLVCKIFNPRYDVAFGVVGVEELMEAGFVFRLISFFVDGFLYCCYLFNASLV